jgi:hypothetical protein
MICLQLEANDRREFAYYQTLSANSYIFKCATGSKPYEIDERIRALELEYQIQRLWRCSISIAHLNIYELAVGWNIEPNLEFDKKAVMAFLRSSADECESTESRMLEAHLTMDEKD